MPGEEHLSGLTSCNNSELDRRQRDKGSARCNRGRGGRRHNKHTTPFPTHARPQIAVQVALVVAKIARSDYPRDWPTLVTDLLGRAHGGSTLTVRPTRG